MDSQNQVWTSELRTGPSVVWVTVLPLPPEGLPRAFVALS